mgnify:CR=1 FL=1|jgi:hypothetical protein
MTELVVPNYPQGTIADIIPSLLGRSAKDLGVEVGNRKQTVLLVLDGLGWDQLIDRWDVAPVLRSMTGGAITTVAPSTTATALTSLTTGLTPGEHGMVGYRMLVDGEVLNTLRWGTDARHDARATLPPELLQPFDPFLGTSVALVSKAEFRSSGFSQAHLRGARLTGYRTLGVLVHEVRRLLVEGESFVYAYYDGIDKVSHEYGLGSEFDAEVSFVDRLVGDVLANLPSGVQLLVTADHGQVDCRDGLRPLDAELDGLIDLLSGEGRFRWLHARSGAAGELLAAADECHRHHAWVRSIEQIVDEGWFGRSVRPEVRDRLGDVALLPFEPIAFDDPADTGPFPLVGRHGSLTSAEMYVPLLTSIAS